MPFGFKDTTLNAYSAALMVSSLPETTLHLLLNSLAEATLMPSGLDIGLTVLQFYYNKSSDKSDVKSASCRAELKISLILSLLPTNLLNNSDVCIDSLVASSLFSQKITSLFSIDLLYTLTFVRIKS